MVGRAFIYLPAMHLDNFQFLTRGVAKLIGDDSVDDLFQKRSMLVLPGNHDQEVMIL